MKTPAAIVNAAIAAAFFLSSHSITLAGGGKWTITGVTAGPLTISFRSTDAAGNQSTGIKRTYTVL
jgi:hypothetical protein